MVRVNCVWIKHMHDGCNINYSADCVHGIMTMSLYRYSRPSFRSLKPVYISQSASPLPCTLWCHQNQHRGTTTPSWCGPALVGIRTQGLVILSFNFRYLQVPVLEVRTVILLPIPTNWLLSVLSFRKIYKVTQRHSLVSGISGNFWLVSWLLFVPLSVPVSWHEVTHRSPNPFWKSGFVIFFS